MSATVTWWCYEIKILYANVPILKKKIVCLEFQISVPFYDPFFVGYPLFVVDGNSLVFALQVAMLHY